MAGLTVAQLGTSSTLTHSSLTSIAFDEIHVSKYLAEPTTKQ